MEQPIDRSDGTTPTYRAYLIGGSGRIETATPIQADNDDDAIDQARLLVDGKAIELWDRARMIVRIEPDAC